MKPYKLALRLTGVAMLGLTAGFNGCNKDEYSVYALTMTGHLLRFSANDPSNLDSNVTLNGLSSGQSVVSIFYRPNDRALLCLTNDNYVCQISPDSGAVSLLASGSAYSSDTLSNVVGGLDPVHNEVRIFATKTDIDDSNLIVDAATGVLSTASSTSGLGYVSGDTNADTTPQLLSIAYDNPRPGVGSTTLYGLDGTTHSLVRIGDQNTGSENGVNNGEVHTVASISRSFSVAGLAVEAKNGDAYVALTPSGGSASLYSIDLGNAALDSLGTIGDGNWVVTALAVVPDF